jgi:hypothetical protein
VTAEQGRGRVDERALGKVREQMRAGVKEIRLKRCPDGYRVIVVRDVTDEPSVPLSCATIEPK